MKSSLALPINEANGLRSVRVAMATPPRAVNAGSMWRGQAAAGPVRRKTKVKETDLNTVLDTVVLAKVRLGVDEAKYKCLETY